MIQTKRDSLEKFIRQQMEGPGACNEHFCCLNNECSEVDEEIINTTPGSLYSTAILFPQRKQVNDLSFSNSSTSDKVVDTDLESDSLYQESQDDNSSEELDERVDRLGADEEDIYSLSQRFPTTIGISCCLDKNGEPLLPSDLTITIFGRYYKKISREECCNIVIKIDDESGFSLFYEKYKPQLNIYYSMVEGGIHLAKDVTKDISAVKDTILTINKELCKSVAVNTDGTVDSEYEQIGDNYRYLKSYKERLWRKLKFFKDTYIPEDERLATEKRIKDVERYIQDHYAENLTLRDLGKMYYINSSYLGQLFHKKYGISFKDYLNNCRINAAAEMLLKSDRKVADIAAEVGYKDIDYFVSKFIEINGCTPTKYRRNI